MKKYDNVYPNPYWINAQMNNFINMCNYFRMYPYFNLSNAPMYNRGYYPQLPEQYTGFNDEFDCDGYCPEFPSHYSRFDDDMDHKMNKELIDLKDYGPNPYVVDIDKATKQNTNFRTTLWTGDNLQVTLMSIKPGEDIGLEIHPDVDQFIRIEQGKGLVKIGDLKDNLNYEEEIFDDYAIMIPAGKWHNIANTGDIPLKLYSIYAPPEHPFGTVHQTKKDAEEAEKK